MGHAEEGCKEESRGQTRQQRKYCTRHRNLTVHDAQNNGNINIELGVGFYMNVSVKGTDCLQKVDGIFISSFLPIIPIKVI